MLATKAQTVSPPFTPENGFPAYRPAMTIPGISVKAGDLLIICAGAGTSNDEDCELGASFGNPILWSTGGNMHPRNVTSSGFAGGIAFKKITADKTGDVTIFSRIGGSGRFNFAAAVIVVRNCNMGSRERTADAVGDSAFPNSGLTNFPLSKGMHYLQGLVVTKHFGSVPDDADGTWKDGFIDGVHARTNTPFVRNIRICEGYKNTTNPTFYRAAKDNITSRPWIALLDCYKP